MKADNRQPAVFFRPYHCVSNERQWRGGFGLPVSFVTGLPTSSFAVHPVWKRVVRFTTDKEAIMVTSTLTPCASIARPSSTTSISDTPKAKPDAKVSVSMVSARVSAPSATTPETTILTAEEQRALKLYRAMSNSDRDLTLTLMTEWARKWPRHPAPRLQLVKGGAA